MVTYEKENNIVKIITTKEEIVDLNKLSQEINDLKNMNYDILEYPTNVTKSMKQAIDIYNEPEIARQVQDEITLDEKQKLFNKLSEV